MSRCAYYVLFTYICEASHANFTIWESKIGEMDAVFPAKTTQVSWWKYSLVYVLTYVPPTLPTSLPTPTYHPRNLELRNCLKVRWQESAMDLLTTRHWGHSRDVACSGHCSFAALTNFSFCLTARNRIWLEWGLQPMRQQVHTLGAALDWLVDLIFIPKKSREKYYER